MVMLAAFACSMVMLMLGERLLLALFKSQAWRHVSVLAGRLIVVNTLVLRLKLSPLGAIGFHVGAFVSFGLSKTERLRHLLNEAIRFRFGLRGLLFWCVNGFFFMIVFGFRLFIIHPLMILRRLGDCKLLLLRTVLFYFLGPHQIVGGLI
jgi:hypothetical protein